MRWEINAFRLHTSECGHKNFLITGKVSKILSRKARDSFGSLQRMSFWNGISGLSFREQIVTKALASFYERLLREAPNGMMGVGNAALQFPRFSYVIPSGSTHEGGHQRSDGQIAWPMSDRSVEVTLFLNREVTEPHRSVAVVASF